MFDQYRHGVPYGFRVATQNRHYLDPDRFLAEARHEDGSWWPAWIAWLGERSGAPTAAPAMGTPQTGYEVVTDAPGHTC